MAGGASGQTIEGGFRTRGGINMKGQTVCSKLLDLWVRFLGRVKSLQICHASRGSYVAIADRVDAESGGQVRLGAKGITKQGDCAGIGGLNAGHDSLNMVI